MDLIQNKNPNAWIAIDHDLASGLTLAPYTLRLKGVAFAVPSHRQ